MVLMCFLPHSYTSQLVDFSLVVRLFLLLLLFLSYVQLLWRRVTGTKEVCKEFFFSLNDEHDDTDNRKWRL